ncbi:hypothetical protein QS968_24950 [Escherichia coli]|uniref:hypothetical protein n=2 Tax=Escherichia coli TaxID=562 RepID=UPI001F039161|nr:hypothetical protein [Escherichia coli]MDL9169456.1 hypothetical protein [Escherichia coli]
MKTTKSGKNHGWRGLQRSKPVYTPLSLRDWVRASPRHPASVRKCSMWLPVLFRFLVDSLATLGHRLAASGITSRMLSVIPLLFFRG